MGDSVTGKEAANVADVFISYHRSPGASALVRRIAGELENRGVSCWYDTQNAAPVDFVERIVMEIESCKAFVFVWDEQANEDSKKRNSYVRSEIQCAYGEKHIALFPFQVGDFEKNKTLKFYFAHINIPYGGDTPETAQTGALINAIADVLGKTQPPPAAPIISQEELEHLMKSFVPPSAKVIKSGECGDNVTYTLDENGVLIISGNGAIRDYSSFDDELEALFAKSDAKRKELHYPSWDDRSTKISRIEIQNGITRIGTAAFDFFTNLKSVSIPDSVTSIGDWAFYDCKKLKRVSVPAKAEIGVCAFEDTTIVTRRKSAENQ